MPEGQGQDAHQRAVAVVALAGRPGLRGGRAGLEGREAPARGDADVEDLAIDGEVPLLIPAEHPTPEVLGVEPAAVQQRVEQAERLRAVVRPRPRRGPRVSPAGSRRAAGTRSAPRAGSPPAREIRRAPPAHPRPAGRSARPRSARATSACRFPIDHGKAPTPLHAVCTIVRADASDSPGRDAAVARAPHSERTDVHGEPSDPPTGPGRPEGTLATHPESSSQRAGRRGHAPQVIRDGRRKLLLHRKNQGLLYPL